MFGFLRAKYEPPRTTAKEDYETWIALADMVQQEAIGGTVLAGDILFYSPGDDSNTRPAAKHELLVMILSWMGVN